MNRFSFFFVTLVALILNSAIGQSDPKRPAVFFNAVDELRPDHFRTGHLGVVTLPQQLAKHGHHGVLSNLAPRLAFATGLASILTTQANEKRDDHSPSVGFESAQAGPFKRLETAVGVWNAAAGLAVVDDKHAKSGKHCLQLTGGKKTSVTLELSDDVDTSGQLKFWAERWTRREPFSFRIEKNSGKGWKEVFHGDKQVRVGRAFLSHVAIPLGDPAIQQLRFTVTSPPNTGVLLDDLEFAPARPQRIVSVEPVPLTIPALVGVDASPLLKLKVTTEGSLAPISVAELEVALSCEAGDIKSAQVYFGGAESDFLTRTPFGKTIVIDGQASPEPQSVAGKQVLTEGENYLWVACTLRKSADIDHRVGAACRRVRFSNGETVDLNATSTQRLGVAVRNGGDDGVHTFRIPGLATTNKGTLIGVYDVRRRGGRDLPGDIDVGMSRSTDGGRTWEPMKVVMDMGDDPAWRYDGIGDPAVLVDRMTGAIWVAATWSHGNRSWVGSGPGLKPEETGQLMLARSDDDGLTWSKPINITPQVKNPQWCFLLQGPGKGITMRDGTIVFAAQYQDPPNTNDRGAHRLPHSTIIYSKDHGKTWDIGTGAFDDTTESQVVEIEPGVLMLNCRYNRKAARVVMTTRDMGRTWQKHATSERALIEPGSCMASLIDVDREVGSDVGNWLLFSNPDSTRGRRRMTIKASPDRGSTWPKENRRLLDEGIGGGYSCLSMVDKKTVGILYEGSQSHMTFQRIPLRDLTARPNVPKAAPAENRQGLKLPRVFNDHMVLQAHAEVPVWGQAKPGEQVAVHLGEVSRVVVANAKGEWSVRLPPHDIQRTAITMTIESAGERVQFSDVLIGEVWVCAGQSNMEWTLGQSDNGKTELPKAGQSQLRLLHLQAGARGSSGSYTADHLSRLTPETFCDGQWKVASAESALEFSAVGWYFGRRLQRELNAPVGLICPAVGGTPTEAWIPREALEVDSDLTGLVADNWLDNARLGEFCRTRGEQNLLAAMQAGERIPGDQFGPNHSFKPGFMWLAGIKPLIPYAIRGAIWYQGESNAESPARVLEHSQLFPLLVRQWRLNWGQGDFPFLYVQLPALNRPEWPWFRDGQRRALAQLENVGMAVTIDTGRPSNVHPTLKKPVGERLAAWALGTTYKANPHTTHAGPLFDAARHQDGSLVLSFKHTGEGLKSSDGKPLRHFEACGADGVFHPANAKIKGKHSVVVSSADVAEPRHARYAWLPYPDPPVNFCNSIELPASPFSTESTEAISARRTAALKSGRPNILFIVSEDNGSHLGCYGEQRVHTPHLDSLASGGVRYTRAYVPYSVCSPSRAAFLTGLYTRQTGHIGLATHRFAMCRDFKTMPAHFQQAGYYTGFLGKTHVNPEKLVEDYIDHRAIRNANFNKAISIKTYADEAGAVMRNAAEAGKPFLLIINYADAHRRFIRKSKGGFPSRQVAAPIEPFPWIGSDTAHLRDEIRDYFNCINRLDEGIGMVLNKLDETGARKDTLVIYISDHGADFPRAKGSIYENGTRIPMIVNYPRKFPQGKVENALVSTIDILPTVLRAAQLPIPNELPGVALQATESGETPRRKYIHTFTTGSAPSLLYMQFGIRDERYKLVFNPDRAPNRLAESRYRNSQLPKDQHVQSFLHPPEYELFDLQADPHEWKNLAASAEHKPIRDRLLKAMQDFQREIKDPFASRENILQFIAEQKEYQNKPYKKPGFLWPHLEMFKEAQETDDAVR